MSFQLKIHECLIVVILCMCDNYFLIMVRISIDDHPKNQPTKSTSFSAALSTKNIVDTIFAVKIICIRELCVWAESRNCQELCRETSL
jgi:hypothetical protein